MMLMLIVIVAYYCLFNQVGNTISVLFPTFQLDFDCNEVGDVAINLQRVLNECPPESIHKITPLLPTQFDYHLEVGNLIPNEGTRYTYWILILSTTIVECTIKQPLPLGFYFVASSQPFSDNLAINLMAIDSKWISKVIDYKLKNPNDKLASQMTVNLINVVRNKYSHIYHDLEPSNDVELKFVVDRALKSSQPTIEQILTFYATGALLNSVSFINLVNRYDRLTIGYMSFNYFDDLDDLTKVEEMVKWLNGFNQGRNALSQLQNMAAVKERRKRQRT